MSILEETVKAGAGQLLDNGEKLIYLEEIYSWENINIVSSKRFIRAENKNGQYTPNFIIPLTDIISLDYTWTKGTFHDDPAISMELQQEKSYLIEITKYEERELLPRAITSVINVPFAVPLVYPPAFVNGMEGEYHCVRFFPKSDLSWPNICPSCLTALNHDDTIYRSEKISSFPTNRRNISAQAVLNIGYCYECYNSFFKNKGGIFKKSPRPPLHNFFYDGLHISVNIDKPEYATEFALINGCSKERFPEVLSKKKMLNLIANGASDVEIGKELKITEEYISLFRREFYREYGVNNADDLFSMIKQKRNVQG